MHVRIMVWDAFTGEVKERFRFTGWRGMLADYCFTIQSPDNRYLIMTVKSKIGSGGDIWLFDMLLKRATLVVANAEGPRAVENRLQSYYSVLLDVIWTPKRVILQLEKQNFSVDLQTRKVTPLQIRGER